MIEISKQGQQQAERNKCNNEKLKGIKAHPAKKYKLKEPIDFTPEFHFFCKKCYILLEDPTHRKEINGKLEWVCNEHR
jgi:hypothetical protein